MGFGVVALFGHDFMIWQQLRTLWSTPLGAALGYLVAAAEILGGVAIQFRRIAHYAALLLALVYLFFACRWIPEIIAAPGVFDHWGSFSSSFPWWWVRCWYTPARHQPRRWQAASAGTAGCCTVCA